MHSTSFPFIGCETGVGGVVNSILEVYGKAVHVVNSVLEVYGKAVRVN
jgi:hypothetical protein